MRGFFIFLLVFGSLLSVSGAQDSASEIGSANAEIVRLYQAGNYSEALKFAQSTLTKAEAALGAEHPDTLTSVNNLAGLYESTGRYGEAEPLYKRALEASERVLGAEHPDTLTSVNNLAFLYERTGRYGEAEPLYKLALEARERVLGAEHPDTLSSVNNLAGLYESTGRYGEAEPLYKRALEARERVLGAEHPNTLTSVNNLAGLYESTGRYGEAEPLYKRALEASERVLGAEHPDTLISVNNLAALYESTGRYGEAEPLYKRALEASERVLGAEHPDTLSSVNNLAALYESTGRYGEAEPLYKRALEASKRVLGAEHPDTISTQGNLSALLVRSGRPGEALRAFRKIDQRLDQWLRTEVRTARAATMRRQMLRLNSRYQDASFSFVLENLTTETASFAADLTLRWKKRLIQDDAVLNNLARETDDSALLELIEAVRKSRQSLSGVAFDPAVSPEEKTRLREALEAREAELRSASEKFRRFQTVSSADAGDVMLALPRNSALIEYRLYDPFDFEDASYGATSLLAVVLRPDADPVVVSLGEASVLFTLQALTVDKDLRTENDTSFQTLMRFGHNRLIAPLLDQLDGVETLYVSPDGPLQALPFEAFLDEPGLRLIERFSVRSLQTGRDLVARDRPATGKGLVAFGGVDFETMQLAALPTNAEPVADASLNRAAIDITRRQFTRFPPLPHTENEVTDIGVAYAAFRPDEPAPVVLTGKEATESAVKALSSPPRVLHFATHGYYLQSGSIEGRPLLQSGITLAGANRALTGGVNATGENGILHAIEAQTLNLYGTELVALSACDTGQGAHDYSEGLEGLPRAFYVAGAKNVLAALWPVGDQAAKEFMKRFYRNWLSQTVSDPPAALRKTKLWYLQQTNPAISDPQNWAPFILFEG
ncbi:CHAT domain-containing tetratricopeptide repeat protein [Roseibium marinum]|uniref:CHAT domain-containing protein n=1 Tax=Roseibium marinum TaxID=281252 RepID=A0A2S3UQ74_9HYPH|nr:tetratricopeptide repeat protein [Roseibium marinum]POF29862.1 CHAT domain-containing protein [Roseibium marinum]